LWGLTEVFGTHKAKNPSIYQGFRRCLISLYILLYLPIPPKGIARLCKIPKKPVGTAEKQRKAETSYANDVQWIPASSKRNKVSKYFTIKIGFVNTTIQVNQTMYQLQPQFFEKRITSFVS
jgi:hypothetical protein